MRIIALLLVAFVALSHVVFLILEMFYWNEPAGRETSTRRRSSRRQQRCWPPTRASITASSPRA